MNDIPALARRVGSEPDLSAVIALYGRILDAGRDALVVYNHEGLIRIWNKAAAELFGWTAGEALGAPISTLVRIVPRETSVPGIAASIMTDGPWEGECTATDRRERVFPAHVRDIPLTDDAQRAECTAMIVYDLTESKQAEEALRRSENHFHQAQKMEAIGRLTDTIMHDINNQLAVISGYCSLVLEMGGHDASLLESIVEISSAARRASALARRLLAYSRNQVPEPRLLDLSALVAEQKKMLERVLGSDVEVETNLAAEPCYTKVDPVGMEQVIMNLAVNARDAMPGGGTLTLTTAHVRVDGSSTTNSEPLPPGTYVSLAVTDTGEGMDEATKSKAFEPFFTTKEKGKGTGLGLSSVQGIVRHHDGHVIVQSEKGKGTTFTIFLHRVDP